MHHVALILTFHDIDVPTAELLGKSACGLTFRRIIDGREQESDALHFAYRRGITWEANVDEVQPGRYRLALISNHLHCSQDISIDEDVIAEGVLHVEFNRVHCRRKLILQR